MDIDTAVENLVREMMSWDTLQIRVRCDQSIGETTAPIDSAISKRTCFYTETRAGQRRLEVENHITSGDMLPESDYCDGTRCASVRYGAEHPHEPIGLMISHGFKNEERFGYTDRPEPLRYFYVGLVPLHDALPGALHIGRSEVIGRPCDRFLFKGVRGQTNTSNLIYDLDRETSVPLRVESYRDQAAIDAKQPAWVWQADSLDTYEGHHMPSKSNYVSYSAKPGNPLADPVASIKQVFTVESLAYNVPVSESAFWPSLPGGINVIDGIEGVAYTTPPDPVTDSGTTAQPIQAGDPAAGTPWLPITGVSLGAILLITALVLWRRQ